MSHISKRAINITLLAFYLSVFEITKMSIYSNNNHLYKKPEMIQHHFRFFISPLPSRRMQDAHPEAGIFRIWRATRCGA